MIISCGSLCKEDGEAVALDCEEGDDEENEVVGVTVTFIMTCLLGAYIIYKKELVFTTASYGLFIIPWWKLNLFTN